MSALAAAKPATTSGEIAASAPPATVTSTSPRRIIAAPTPIASAPLAQALVTEKLAAFAPSRMLSPPEAMSASDGQWDFEVIAQIGRSYWPTPVYANIDLGYRLRETNDTIHHNPDDELIYNAEVGGSPIEMLNLALKLEGISSAGRRITYLIPTVHPCFSTREFKRQQSKPD